MSPADRWRVQLEAWRIPDELLAAVEESPYGWPQRFWKRRSAVAADAPEPHTLQVVRSLLGERGSVLDVGAGRGRASLPLARDGHHLSAVERDPGMAAGLAADASALGVEVDLFELAWPEAANSVPRADIVMSAHVVYDVGDIVPFLTAMIDHADEAVVIELSERHPWAGLAPYYRALHGLERPDGPTADDFAAVVTDIVGHPPHVESWARQGGLYFENWDELAEVFGRRLVLPRRRWAELEDLLDVTEVDGRLYVGGEVRELVTVWWEVA